MARRLRLERSGVDYHVMNRGSARRTIFDTRADFRFFLSCLAHAVRRGEILVLAYVLMRTHFHLLLRSCGGISVAMQRVQLRHVRRFNRLHRRDGPLLRGRYLSKPVDTTSYQRNAVRYIHENPVLARLCREPWAYPWSSASLVVRPRTPLWFCDEAVRASGPLQASPRAVMEARAELIEARLQAPTAHDEDAPDASTPGSVLAWMQRKARLADGTTCPAPLAGAETLLGTLETIVPRSGDQVMGVPGAGTYPTRLLLATGLLRDIAACTFKEVAARLGVDPTKAKRLYRLHTRCVGLLPVYASAAAEVVRRCVRLIEDA